MVFNSLFSSSAGNAYELKAKGLHMIIECGVRYAALQRAMKYRLPDYCLVTHEHQDHSKSVHHLTGKGVEIVCSDGTAEMLGVAKTYRVNLPFVQMLDADHDAQGRKMFVVDWMGERLFFATDTASVPHTVDGVTHLAIEANWSKHTLDDESEHSGRSAETHLSLESACEFVEKMDKSKLREVHLIHLSDGNSSAKFFREQMQAVAGVPVYVAGR